MKFESKRLDEVAEIVGGGTPSTKVEENWDGEVPWLTPKDLSTFEGIYVTRGSRSLTEKGFKSSSARMLPAGSVLYTSRAPIGYVAIAKNPISTNQGFKSLILKHGYVPEFVFYLLKASKAEIESHASGGTFAEISARALGEVVLNFPSKNIQEAISRILLRLDEKIEINIALSKTLESIAQSIFKSWFIDFDPVHAKSRGEKPFGMDDETAALFPDSFEESELGLIPKGWNVGRISQLCRNISNGSTPRRLNERYWNNGEVDWYKTGELSDRYLLSSDELITKEAVNETSVKLLPAGSILMAIYASPTVGRLGILTKPSTFNQACTGLIPNDEIGTCFLYLHLYFNRDYFNSMASGAAQQNISKAIVENCPVVMPSLELIEAFRKLCDLQFQEMQTISLQSSALETLRDSLLPRLISGELQIPEELLVS